jgi:hypothetical protein
LVTPAGSLTFNGSGDGLYLTDVVGLDGSDIRNPVDDLPQHDGSEVHRFFRSGRVVTLRGFILANAGETVRRASADNLRGYTDRLLRPTNTELVSSCRLRFTPSGASERMLDKVRLFEPVQITGGYLKSFEFTLVSPLPYLLDTAQTTTSVTAGTPVTITNGGNATMWPVIQADGAFSTATLANTTTGESLVFTAGVAAAHYAEVDNFRKTIYTDGTGANLLSSVNWGASKFLSLKPGANTIAFTTASGRVYWQNAWV